MGEYDIIVVGAGISGIAFARFFLDTHPSAKLVVLERESGPGGVWSRARSYPGFWSQTGLGMTEFSDREMHVPADARLLYNLPEARLVTDYLEAYCDNHVYAGRSLRERIVFNVEVEGISKVDDTWHVETSFGGKAREVYKAERLVVASGLYSRPNLPDLPQIHEFRGKVIHQREFGRSSILTDPKIEDVVVLGGAKSAADIAYASAVAGKQVSWILRDTGSTGPGAFVRPNGVLWYKNAPEVASTRLTSLLTPSIYSPQTWVSWLCHGTSLGRWLMRKVFATTDEAARTFGQFRNRKGAREGFSRLESNPDYFWLNGWVGMAQQPDFWEVIAQKVDVFRSDIVSLSSDSISLADGSILRVDAILCGTGFQSDFSVFKSPSAASLGLPVPSDVPEDEFADWQHLEQQADQEIVRRFPGLANPPPPRKVSTTPYRLYQLIASLRDPSIVFLGYVGILNAFYAAECQAIWATAYFDKVLDLPDLPERVWRTAYQNAFSKRRYPFLGQEGHMVNYDMIGYCDGLLEQVGVGTHLQGSWWTYWFGICCARTLKGIAEEYRHRYGGKA